MIDKNKALIILRSARTRKYAIRFAVAFVVVGVLGFLVLPPIVQSVLLKQLAQTLVENQLACTVQRYFTIDFRAA